MIFRVHFSDGEKIDVEAATPNAAQAAAVKRHPTGAAHVTKVKRVRA